MLQKSIDTPLLFPFWHTIIGSGGKRYGRYFFTKSFKDLFRRQAGSQADFPLPETGEVFGFLGPNGAGKTTTVKLLNGMLAPSAGSCRVLGLDPAGVPEKVHALSGVVTEHAQMYDNLSGMQNLLFYASIFGVPGAEAQERADSLLRQLELEEARDRRLSAYSTGMRQRLSLARALIHRPKVLFLDEPTSGLDPESAQNVNRLIQELAKQEGITVFLCTHQLRYAQEICTRYGLIEEGQLLAAGTLDELRRKVRSGAMLQICADNMPEKLPFQKAGAGQYEMTIQSDDEIPKIVRRIVLGGGDIFAVEVKKPSLEDIYFTLTAGKRGKHNEKCHDCCYQKGYSRCHGQQAFIRQPPGRPGGADCHPTHHLFYSWDILPRRLRISRRSWSCCRRPHTPETRK